MRQHSSVLDAAACRRVITIKVFFFICCFGFAVTTIWVRLVTVGELPIVNDSLVQEALANVAKDPRFAEVYRKTSKLPNDLKYILLWTPKDFAPFYFLESGQRAFIKNNCTEINCFVTDDKHFFKYNITKFDAIAFNGRNINEMEPYDLPPYRSPHQKFIFFNMESADNYPICNEHFDNFFNWTSTYRLDSDIPYPYIQIKNSDGEVVGPKQNMEWLDKLPEVDEDLASRLMNKSKAAAWFVSHCSSRSGRKTFVKSLQKELAIYGLSVDIYGNCGPFKCPRNRKLDCDAILEKDYYFYLSLENSFAEDYVTEKLLTALQHDTVPIVFGGANYSRFLPPGSYLDGRRLSIRKLAMTIADLISSPKKYLQYFRWKNQYSYHDPAEIENVCKVCAALNNKTKMSAEKVYKDFRSWWNPYYFQRCKR